MKQRGGVPASGICRRGMQERGSGGTAGHFRPAARLPATGMPLFLGSIHVAQVALVLLELVHPSRSVVLGEAAVLLGDGVEGGINVLGHARGIAADVEGCSVLEPLPEFGTLLDHEILDV